MLKERKKKEGKRIRRKEKRKGRKKGGEEGRKEKLCLHLVNYGRKLTCLGVKFFLQS